jgi:hypothetical protein
MLVPRLDLVEQRSELAASLAEGNRPCHEGIVQDFVRLGQSAGSLGLRTLLSSGCYRPGRNRVVGSRIKAWVCPPMRPVPTI